MKINPDPLKVVDVPVCTGCRKRAPWCSCGKMDYRYSNGETVSEAEANPWAQFKPSPGRGRANWLVIEELDDGSTIEAYVTSRTEAPIVVELVTYGPRGGVRTQAYGSVETIPEEISRLTKLRDVAEKLEHLR